MLALVAALAPARADVATFTVLLANVGNSNVSCQPYAFKLCYQQVEDRIAANIQAHGPDIVALIEVLPVERCATAYAGLPEPDPQKVCAQTHEVEHQARRLVGPGYAIACDARFGWDCVAAKDATVLLDEAAPGTVEPNGLATAEAIEGCDPGFTVNVAIANVTGVGAFRVVLAHPDSGFTSGEAGTACRVAQLEQAFVLAEGPTLLVGDMNMDPYRASGSDVALWDANVGEGARFRYHSGIAENAADPFPTYFMGESSNLLPTGALLPTVEDPSGVFARQTLDHVVSDSFFGTCATLGEAEGTTRLDGGPGGGMDHRALLCALA